MRIERQHAGSIDAQSASPGNAPAGRVLTGFAGLPADALLDETAVALVLEVSKRTVRRMVARYELPPPVRFAGRSTWQAARILAWFHRRADRAEREARRRAERTEAIQQLARPTDAIRRLDDPQEQPNSQIGGR